MRTESTRSGLRTAVLLVVIGTALAACGSTTDVSDARSSVTDGFPDSSEPTVTIAAEWETIESVEDLASRVEAVVVGVVGEEFARYPLFEPGVDVEPSLVNIIHTVVVEEVIANDPMSGRTLKAGDRIFVSYPDLGVSVGNITPYRAGDHLVFFLVSTTFVSPDLKPLDGWEPFSSDSGIFDVVGNEARSRTSVGPMKGSVLPLSEVRDRARAEIQPAS